MLEDECGSEWDDWMEKNDVPLHFIYPWSEIEAHLHVSITCIESVSECSRYIPKRKGRVITPIGDFHYDVTVIVFCVQITNEEAGDWKLVYSPT